MRCPITYQNIESGKYSHEGLHSLSPKLDSLIDLPLTLSEILGNTFEERERCPYRVFNPN